MPPQMCVLAHFPLRHKDGNSGLLRLGRLLSDRPRRRRARILGLPDHEAYRPCSVPIQSDGRGFFLKSSLIGWQAFTADSTRRGLTSSVATRRELSGFGVPCWWKTALTMSP